MTFVKRQYQHPDGRIFSVELSLSFLRASGWTTYWSRPDKVGLTRYRSVLLPWRETQAQAQADLDAWAMQYGRYKGPRVKEVMHDV